MEMMLPRITTFFHASASLVYPLFPSLPNSLIFAIHSQEDNDQAFSLTR